MVAVEQAQLVVIRPLHKQLELVEQHREVHLLQRAGQLRRGRRRCRGGRSGRGRRGEVLAHVLEQHVQRDRLRQEGTGPQRLGALEVLRFRPALLAVGVLVDIDDHDDAAEVASMKAPKLPEAAWWFLIPLFVLLLALGLCAGGGT